MRVLAVDLSAPSGFGFGERPEPEPGPDQLVVEVEAFSLIDRDLRYAPAMLGAGGVWGFDAVGHVVVPAADGTGPGVGVRVVLSSEAPSTWAERVAIGAADVARIPDTWAAGPTAAMVVPAVSAQLAVIRLGELGLLDDKTLLVTGGTGAVAWYTIQLARRSGARVVAVTRDPSRTDELTALGAAEVISDLDAVNEPIHAAVDVVGGPTLVHVYELLAEHGVVLSVGQIADQPAAFGPRAFLRTRRAVESFWGAWPMGTELATLVALVGAGKLRQQPLTHEANWGDHAEVLTGLAAGTIRGKAALRVVGTT